MEKNSKGFIILEVLVAMAIVVVSFGVFLEMGNSAIRTSTSLKESISAGFLAKELIEVSRSFRDGTEWSVSGLGVQSTGEGSPYHFDLNTSQSPAIWTLASGQETVGAFTRKIIIDRVSRDPTTQDIENVYNASHDDSDTRKITALVSWGTKTSKIITYFTNW